VRNEWGDHNVYLWNMPVPGDWTYWDAVSRNPSPLARDFWVIPQRDMIRVVVGTSGGTGLPDDLGSMEGAPGGDYNYYVWNVPVAGDWTYWDAVSRNPSPLARDLWEISSPGPTFGMAAPCTGGGAPAPPPAQDPNDDPA